MSTPSPNAAPHSHGSPIGVPVRLLGLLGPRPSLGPLRHAVVLRGRGVLEPLSVLVVHHLGRPSAHLRGAPAHLRGPGRGDTGLAHGPHGSTRDLPGPPVLLAPADARVRHLGRHRGQGLPGPRRQTKGQDRAPLPGTRGVVPRRAGRPRPAPEHRRAQRGGPAVVDRAGERPGALGDQGASPRSPGQRAALLVAPTRPAL
jgi:hypothetical protein